MIVENRYYFELESSVIIDEEHFRSVEEYELGGVETLIPVWSDMDNIQSVENIMDNLMFMDHRIKYFNYRGFPEVMISFDEDTDGKADFGAYIRFTPVNPTKKWEQEKIEELVSRFGEKTRKKFTEEVRESRYNLKEVMNDSGILRGNKVDGYIYLPLAVKFSEEEKFNMLYYLYMYQNKQLRRWNFREQADKKISAAE